MGAVTPGVLDLDELPLADAEKQVLAESLAAYRDGDLLATLASIRQGDSQRQMRRIYLAALLLVVGNWAAEKG
jgi:hypothetical protein